MKTIINLCAIAILLAISPLCRAQLTNEIANLGGNATFSVTPTGTPPFSYQWYKNGFPLTDGSNLSGANSNILALANVTLQDNGLYSAIASDAYGTPTRLYAYLTVGCVPSTIIAWGSNAHGQTNVPPGLTNAVAIAGGGNFGLALTEEGTVVAWGDNTYGETNVPAGLSNVVAIAGGGDHALALQNNGTVVAWGENNSGQTNVPAGLSNVVEIAAGADYSLALQGDGNIVAWGDDSYGQCDIPSGLTNVVAIAAEWDDTIVLKGDGTIFTFGAEISTFNQTNEPANLTNVASMTRGANFGLAIRNDGTVVGWGRDLQDQTDVPAGLSNVVAVAGGGDQSLAIQTNLMIVAWGSGIGTDVPAGLSNVVAIAAGLYSQDYSMALVDTPCIMTNSVLTNVLYGTTTYGGGSWNNGTVFKIAPGGYETVLYSFSNSPDGYWPVGDLVLDGNTLYGITRAGGLYGAGTIYRINTDGSGYTNLYSFGTTSVYTDGSTPLAGLVLSGNTLYGTTDTGGAYSNDGFGNGTIFEINTDGSGYSTLYNFDEGANPVGGLTLSSNILYGTTECGGTVSGPSGVGEGTIFCVCTNGLNYQTLYSFGEGASDGFYPQAGLIFSNNTLYGTTGNGGTYERESDFPAGTVFSYNLTNFAFQTLFSFGATNDEGIFYDGVFPLAGVVLAGDTLYGTTSLGGLGDEGVIFSIGIDGSGFKVLQNFAATGNNGADPLADLITLGDSLFGTTAIGGTNDCGEVFGVNTNGNDFSDIYDFKGSVSASDGSGPEGGVCAP